VALQQAGFGLANVALALALVFWRWPKNQGQNFGGLACSRLDIKIHHSLPSSEHFKIHVPYIPYLQ